jgi:hypothetical protein
MKGDDHQKDGETEDHQRNDATWTPSDIAHETTTSKCMLGSCADNRGYVIGD